MNDAPAADRVLARLVLVSYLASLALLPWSWFPPFPLPFHHAQWSDAVFSATAALWIAEKWRGGWPQLKPVHLAIACYFAAAFLSLVFATPNKSYGALKLLGIAELCALAIITSDLASRPGATRAIARTVAVTSILAGAAAVAGVLLFYAGVRTRLTGTYGDLIPSAWYARAQAGAYQPNLLASYCIFASAVVASARAEMPGWLRRVAQAVLWVAVALTLSRAIMGFALAAIIRRAHTRRRRAAAALCAAVFALLIISLSIWNLSLDPTRPLDARFDSSAAPSRWQSITTSFETLVASPLFGSGLATHPGRYRGLPFDAHLTPLNIAATTGLPALIAFTAVFALLWRDCEGRCDIAIWSGLAGLALDGLANDIEDYRHLWVLAGLAAAQASRPDPAI
ncbi:MAG TPA: O-antigen ligase family protein [Blastocatellia bacterium]|nr:O-antigen ligase family protein [Blastocatellia bacterium]